MNNGGCSTRCSNKEGSFECSCNHGYKLAADRLSCNGRFNLLKAINVSIHLISHLQEQKCIIIERHCVCLVDYD